MTGFIAASILALATPGSAEVRAHGVEVAEAEFRGLKALQLRHRADPGLALIEGVAFRNGEISMEVAGMVDPDASLITRHFARGFIGVEVIAYDDYAALGGEHAARDAGKMRLEGRDYVVRDGDVLRFRFNV